MQTARTVERVRAQPTVLVAQGTTELDITPHQATRGVGPLAHPARRGLLVHGALAVGVNGVPLGLVHQQVWMRDAATTGEKQQWRKRAASEKESQLWVDGLAATEQALPAEAAAITMADREAGSA